MDLRWVGRALGGCGGFEMGIERFCRYGGPRMGVHGLGWVWRVFWNRVWKVWDEYEESVVGKKGLGLAWRAYGGCKRLRKSMCMGVKGFVWVWRARDECKRPWVGLEGLRWMRRAFSGGKLAKSAK